MRIIRGKYKGRQLKTPKNLPVRPTTNFAKESIFNIISNYFDFEDLAVLDLFSGTGNITFEFASREVKSLISLDSNYNCIKFLKQTADEYNTDNLTVLKADAFQFLKNCNRKFDLIFADPPYHLDTISEIPDLIFSKALLEENGWFILEHAPKINFENHPNFSQHRKYGHVNFSIFSH